jgi:hypothetical protein
MRTIIEIPQPQLDALDGLCRLEGISRAEAIRRAIARLVHETRPTTGNPAFGLWRNRPVDGLDYQRRLRDEWDAPAAKRAPAARRTARPRRRRS